MDNELCQRPPCAKPSWKSGAPPSRWRGGKWLSSCPRCLRRLLERFPLLKGVLHLAGVAAVVGADDAVLRHPVDHACGAAVADAERALEQRHAASAFADDDLDGLLIKRIALAHFVERSGCAAAGGLQLQ